VKRCIVVEGGWGCVNICLIICGQVLWHCNWSRRGRSKEVASLKLEMPQGGGISIAYWNVDYFSFALCLLKPPHTCFRFIGMKLLLFTVQTGFPLGK
jgi:hypothetical protein